MGYAEELKFVINSDNDIFPDFLFNPLINDFGDDYFNIASSQDPIVLEAQKIRRKYRNYFTFVAALASYNEYMNHLVDKYGSIQIIKNSIKVGMFEDFVPPKPKLKLNAKNKEFLRAKIVPSEKVAIDLGDNAFKDISRELFPIDLKESHIQEDDRYTKLKGPNKKIVRRAIERMSGQHRRDNLYRTTGNNSGTDFIVEYMNQASKGFYDDKGNRTEYSISDIVKQEEMQKGVPEELILDEETANTSVIVGDRLRTKKDQQRFEIMKDLYMMGIDLLDNSKLMDKRVVKMIKLAAGRDSSDDVSNMTKKELKKFKQRQKKEKASLKKRQDNDKILSQTLLNNKYSFQHSGNNISFKLRDLYNDE